MFYGKYMSQIKLVVFIYLNLPEHTEDQYVQMEAVEKIHQMIPQKVNVEFENTNITLSMHSQKRWVDRGFFLCVDLFCFLTDRPCLVFKAPELDNEIFKAWLWLWWGATSPERVCSWTQIPPQPFRAPAGG